MQENNGSEENTQNDSSDKHEPGGPPMVGGDVFHPESNEPTPPAAETPSEQPSTPEEKPELLAIPPQPTKNKSKKGILALVIVLLLAGGAAAWWFTQKKDDPKTSQQSSVKETKDIDLLRVGSTEGPASVYFPDEGINGVQNIMDRQLYEGLVGFEGSKIVPRIAESWTNPDEKTWVFKIRPNVTFHTNKPVTAKEVKASLDDLKKYEYWSLFVSTIDSVEATGELEVTIKTKAPDALLLNRLVLAYVTDLTDGGKPGNNGTGAYQVDSTAKNDEKNTTLVAFDKYYLGHVKTRKLQYKLYNNDDEIVKALKDNEIDIAETLPIPSVTEALKGSDYTKLNFTSPGIFGLYMNQKRGTLPIMKNKDFRTALALAMNRQELVDKTGNRSEPATQVIPKSLPGYDQSLSFPAFDLVAAKAALTKSGYKNQPVELIVVEEIQTDPPVVIEQLKALGINLKVKSFKADDVGDALADLKEGSFDLFVAGYTSDISDARDILGSLLSSSESTYPVYNDPVFDKLLTDSDTTFDPVARINILQQANKLITDEVAWVPLRTSGYVAYYPKDIDIKIEFNGGGSVGAYYWKVGRIAN